MKGIRRIYALCAMLSLGVGMRAQDATIDFENEAEPNSKVQTFVKGENVSFTFNASGSANKGAVLYGSMTSVYYITVTAPKSIAVIEFQTQANANKTIDATANVGSVIVLPSGTQKWEGSSTSVTIVGDGSSCSASVKRMRVWFDKSQYDPDTPWATSSQEEEGDRPYTYDVDLTNDNIDYSQRDRLYSSVNVLPTNGKGVPMVVVSVRKFKETLAPYLEWKTQQGYDVKEIYADDVLGGLQGVELAKALRQKIMALNPRPAYVLIAGDHTEVPPFFGFAYKGTHAADCYYGEFTNDHYADAYVGRFSASNVNDLKAQLDKTEYMAKIASTDATWLKRSLTVDGVSDDIKAMQQALILSSNYPKNFEGNTTEVQKASYTSAINNYIDNGCSFVNYFGHGMNTYWSGNYTTYDISRLNNANKYPVVLSITCLTGNFDIGDCFAEVFMRRANAGAVACVAASRESFANTNNYIFRGDGGGEKKSESIGMFRSLFPFVGSDLSQRARTIGQAMDIGCLAVARTVKQSYNEVCEFYNLFGDPTYQPYITVPKENTLSASSYNITAGRNITVHTAPDAMVCLSQGRTVIVAGMSDDKGVATLHVPLTDLSGECTLYSSAPGYNDVWRKVTLSAGNGSEEGLPDEAVQPHVTFTDIISLEKVGQVVTASTPSSQAAFSGTESQAKYAIFAFSDKYKDDFGPNGNWVEGNSGPARGFYLQNNWDPCSMITTQSGGKARTVAVEWIHPTGMGEVLGVYGSNTAYYDTKQAWNGQQGELVGTLVKGVNNTLTIEKDYKYLLFRAEPRKEFPSETSDVYIKSLSIGWEQEVEKCETPQIDYADGRISFRCGTADANYHYGIAPNQNKVGEYVLSVYADAPGYGTSDMATRTISAGDIVTASGDIDKDGKISVADIVKLIDSFKK
ncbi:MAG: hypothetical protein KBT12_08390 [Bacteroidales bacterium]|nr:hypothetical protein [Candidatus Physcousia equi]